MSLTVRTLLRPLHLAALLAAYGVVRLLGRPGYLRRVALGAFAIAAIGIPIKLAGCGGGLRVGTFNIQQLGSRATDMDRLTNLVRGLDVDILAVQEIQKEVRLEELARRASQGGRRYRFALSSCGGRSGMRVGFLYDTERVSLRSTREYPELDPGGGGSCSGGERAALLGVFVPRNDPADERALDLLVVHLHKGGDPGDVAARKKQWVNAYRVADALRRDGARNVAILGDANSTGYLDDEHAERRSVDEAAGAAGMVVATRDLGCSEYWAKESNTLAPSLLDHLVATPGLAHSVRVGGYCAASRCAPLDARDPPPDYARVSDHCPVTAVLTP